MVRTSRERAWVALVACGAVLALLAALALRDGEPPGAERSAGAGAPRAPSARDRPELETPRGALRRAPEGGPAEIPVDAQEAALGEAEAAPRGALVRSSRGYALGTLWVEVRDGEPRQVDLDAEGRLPAGLRPPFALWAAGHGALSVATYAEELELAPDLSIELAGDDIAGRVAAVELAGVRAGQRLAGDVGLLWQHLGRDRLGLAVCWERVHRLSPGLHLTDTGGELWRLALREGATGTFEVPLELPDRPLGALRVSAECPCGEGDDQERVLWAERPRGLAPARPQVFAWGELYHQRRWSAVRALAPAEEPRVALGVEWGVSVLCRACGSYGRTHATPASDPTRVEVELRRGLLVRGRADRELWDALQLLWRQGVGRDGDAWWRGETRVALDEGGGFALALPHRVPMPRASSWPMPPELLLEVRAAGCDPLVLALDAGNGGDLDLGLLPLVSRPAAISLAPGHGLEAAAVDGVRVAPDAGVPCELEASGARLRADGSLEVFLEDRGAEELLLRGDLPRSVLVCVNPASPVGFEKGAGGYVRVPPEVSLFEVRGELPADLREVSLGWTWRGIDYAERVVDGEALASGEVRAVVHPAGADRAWWSVRGARPVDGIRGRVVRLEAGGAAVTVP